jgi:hypothetical protein
MTKALTGKTITITTHKDANVDEIVELVRSAFSRGPCTTCTSGGHLVVREAEEISLAPGAKAHASVS